MLMGPGRWGTTTPSLGVPVKYSEINNMSVIVEIAYMRDDLIPEVSYGTHFFQDMVESDTYYIAIFPEQENVIFNLSIATRYPDIVGDLDSGRTPVSYCHERVRRELLDTASCGY